ncbi:MAG: ATP-dependent zinc metalloprotease FtsH [Myxococcales bacterium]|nr:ATP-dependent zinc metalloprotease FtsH [Myxococcales bacterium]
MFTVLLLLWYGQVELDGRSEVPTWSEFKEQVAAGRYDEVVLAPEQVKARVKSEGEDREWVHLARIEDPALLPLLEEHKVAYRAARPNPCQDGMVSMLILIPLGVLLLAWIVMGRNMGQGGRSAAAFGRSGAALAPEEGTGITFEDVAGVEEAVEELKEIVAFLETPEKFTSLGGRPPKGVLLVGPPGTGKTLLARAVAGEAGVPFFSISGSSFVEMFVGVGAARVRDLFKTAIENAPCIIFIDELDAVGRARGAGGPGSNEEREQTLNQMLVEMDGFDNRGGVIVMAATNRPEILDPALLRAGRFDRQVLVDRPDLAGRTKILTVHGAKLTLSDEVRMEEIARLTPGLAGADLANVLNEAALLAARRDKEAVELVDIKEAVERVVAGLEKKSRRLSEKEKRMTAYHECGHAICSAASPGADPVHKISIIPRGFALGYTMYVPVEDRFSSTKSELLNRIVSLFGGRAAEALVFGDVTTGAQNDIQRATDIARKMVTEYGMSKRIGAVNYGPRNENAFGIGFASGSTASPHTAEEIEQEVRAILDRCNTRAMEILIRNRPLLEDMSLYLYENEVLEGDIMQDYLSRSVLAESLEDRPTAEWVPEELVEDV